MNERGGVGGSRNATEAFRELMAGFASTLGLDLMDASGDRVTATWDPAPVLKDEDGTVLRAAHSGVVETLASIGAALWMGERGQVVGVSNNTDFLHVERRGPFLSTATPVDRSHTQQLWLVRIDDGDGRLIARGHVRLANLVPMR